MATSGEDARIAIWQPGARQAGAVLKGHTAPVVSLAVSPDGKTLASASLGQHGAPVVARGRRVARARRAPAERQRRRLHTGRARGRERELRPDTADLAARRMRQRRRSSLCPRPSIRSPLRPTAASSRQARPARSTSCRPLASSRARSRRRPSRSSRSPCRATASWSLPPAFAARVAIIESRRAANSSTRSWVLACRRGRWPFFPTDARC